MRKLAVIIPCYNKLAWTQKTVESLLDCTVSDLYLILVDDGSTDGTAGFAKQISDRMNQGNVRFYYHQNIKNIGVNASWNVGLKMAMELTTPYICIANNDLLFTKNWDVPILNALNSDFWLVSPYSTERQLPEDWPNGRTRHTNPVGITMPILGACFAFRRETIDRIGYFPEQCRHYFGDNWIKDMCIVRDLKVGHIYESYVHHFFCQTTHELDNNKWFREDGKAYNDFCRNFKLEEYEPPKVRDEAADNIKKTEVTFVLLACNEKNDFFVSIGSLLCQTNPNWKAIIFHNGPNPDLRTRIETTFNDSRISFYCSAENNGTDTLNRETAFHSLVNTEFVVSTSIQDYYFPKTVEEILHLASNNDFIFWNSINHLWRENVPLNCEPKVCRIDWGNFAIRTSVAKLIPIQHRAPTADGFFAEEVVKRSVKCKKIEKILTIHN